MDPLTAPVHIGDAMRQFLEGPCGLIVGAIGPDGLPHAAYAWGLAVSPDGSSVRVITEAGPAFSVGAGLAVAAADVRTYRTLQIKGVIRDAQPLTPEDRYLAKQHIDGFVAEVVAVDNFSPELMRLFPPDEFDVYVVDVVEIFDQSPGPNAGTTVDGDTWRRL